MRASLASRAGAVPALLGFLWASAGSAVAEVPAAFEDGVIQRIEYPDWFKDSFLTLPDDAAEAAEAGKQGLFVFFSTQGCSYCHLFLATSLSDPVIVERLRAHFDSIGLEIFSDAELTDFTGSDTRVKQFALDQGVEFAPSLLFFGSDGEQLLGLTGYYGPERFAQVLDYLIDGHYRGQSLRDYLAALETPSADWTLSPDPLFAAPPYALDRSRMPAERPLLVIFEGTDCHRCPRFHGEVLGDSSTRARLGGFDVVRLDAADAQTPVLTPAGARTTPRAWYDTLGFSELPALVFFDEGGEQVLATDAVVLKSRMNNAIGFVTERAYAKGWNYQRYARQQGLENAAGGTP